MPTPIRNFNDKAEFFTGLVAAQKLLIGLRKAPTSSKNYRLYQKNGNAETAMKDFQSVGPRVVTNTKNQKRKLYNVYRTGRRVGFVAIPESHFVEKEGNLGDIHFRFR